MSTAGNGHAVTFADPAAALAASAAAAAAARRADAVPPLATPPAAHGGPIPIVWGTFLPEEGNARGVGHHATHAPPPRRWDRPNWDQNPFAAFEADGEAEGEFTPATAHSPSHAATVHRYCTFVPDAREKAHCALHEFGFILATVAAER